MSHIYAKEEEHTETDQRSIEKKQRTQPSEQQRSRQSIKGSRQSYWEPYMPQIIAIESLSGAIGSKTHYPIILSGL